MRVTQILRQSLSRQSFRALPRPVRRAYSTAPHAAPSSDLPWIICSALVFIVSPSPLPSFSRPDEIIAYHLYVAQGGKRGMLMMGLQFILLVLRLMRRPRMLMRNMRFM